MFGKAIILDLESESCCSFALGRRREQWQDRLDLLQFLLQLLHVHAQRALPPMFLSHVITAGRALHRAGVAHGLQAIALKAATVLVEDLAAGLLMTHLALPLLARHACYGGNAASLGAEFGRGGGWRRSVVRRLRRKLWRRRADLDRSKQWTLLVGRHITCLGRGRGLRMTRG